MRAPRLLPSFQLLLFLLLAAASTSEGQSAPSAEPAATSVLTTAPQTPVLTVPAATPTLTSTPPLATPLSETEPPATTTPLGTSAPPTPAVPEVPPTPVPVVLATPPPLMDPSPAPLIATASPAPTSSAVPPVTSPTEAANPLPTTGVAVPPALPPATSLPPSAPTNVSPKLAPNPGAATIGSLIFASPPSTSLGPAPSTLNVSLTNISLAPSLSSPNHNTSSNVTLAPFSSAPNWTNSSNTTTAPSISPLNRSNSSNVTLAPFPSGPNLTNITNTTASLAPSPAQAVLYAPAPAPGRINVTLAPGPSPDGARPSNTSPAPAPAQNASVGNSSQRVQNTTIFVPGRLEVAPSSQLPRGSGNVRSVAPTANYQMRFSTAVPQNMGSVLQGSPQANFTNQLESVVQYHLDPASGQQCGQSCVAFCQLDDDSAKECGKADASAATGRLSDGYHRMTVRYYATRNASEPFAVYSTFFLVDSVPPTISIALQAADGEARVFEQLRHGQPTLFVFWDSLEPFPGRAVLSEPIEPFSEDSLLVEGGTLVGWQREESLASGGTRRLLQEGGNSSAVAYRFQVFPSGVGPSLIRVSARPGATDRALNPMQLTGESEYTVYFDARRPKALLALVVTGPAGVTSLSSAPELTSNSVVAVLLSFDERVYGFSPSSLNITNGTLTAFGPEEAIESGGSSYALTIAIDPLGNLLIQAPENITFNAVGKGNEASNQLQVQHYVKNENLEAGIRAMAAVSLGLLATSAGVSASVSFMTAAASITTFAARQNLQAPLPAPYLDASSGLSFSLFNWPCPFDGLIPTASALDNLLPGNSGSPEPQAPFESRTLTWDNGSVPVRLTVLSRATVETVPFNASVEADPSMYGAELTVNADRRALLAENDGLRALVRAVFWVLTILVLMVLFHSSKALAAWCLRRHIAPSLFVFPGPELIFLTFATLPLTHLCVRALTGGTMAAIVLASVVLTCIAAHLVFLTGILWIHVVNSKSVAFVREDSDDDTRSCFRAPVHGTWQVVDPSEGNLFVAKYGFFYTDFAGRPSKLHLNNRSFRTDLESVQLDHNDRDLAVESANAKMDPPARAMVPGSVKLTSSTAVEENGRSYFTDKEEVAEEARLALEEGAENARRVVRRVGRFGPSADLRPLWKVVYLLIVLVEISMLGATKGIRASYWQVGVSFSLRLVLVMLLILFRPFRATRLQLAEVLSAMCELGVVLSALALLIRQNVRSPAGKMRTTQSAIGYVMVGLQVAAVVISVVNSVITVIKEGIARARGGFHSNPL
ncbi:hypothetical protein KFL_006650020 [Klebsormidium nitens]|uniref:Bacterial Ig-like domain-containing protein n=1 Tax=Klebsormidium nitens TaxID=105231 RepID=A0A1Y1IR57_KLENI|nr:hypothetical protein KFL_006650020 [Klebsormidium nitens]|eukprot:GAQ90628.1 hypothetical protein KFL_006650020 [Klebsormidium nitens]